MSKGNTVGKIVGTPSAPKVPAAEANPPVKAETAAEASTGAKVMDGVQLGLDVVGLIPGVGEIADLANAGISAARGDWVGASLSLASAIPFAGWGASAAKVGRRGAQMATEASAKAAKEAADRAAKEAAEKAAKEAAEKAEKEAAERAGKGKDGGKVKAQRMKEHQVKCFKKNSRGDPAEYDRQLLDQERGLNNLSVKEYLEGRAKYQEIGRHGTGAAQAEARAKYAKELANGFEKQLRKQGVRGTEAQQQAAQIAADRMSTLAALHNPDMIAGGKDVVTSMGDRGVNSSIGSQWKDRVAGLDKAAKEIPEAERGDTKMNAKLKRCKQ
ncbi:polymorphic toxin type 15 domain-containing protein [Chitinimonas taiwanensis]|uniref:Novel toxin 15 n=1 Tax=Chitinimonas taiwanensis DSM 18899 TaxID=1121279 RepID=A0A1K2HK28_9NEIS|nr:polymorphic toxin type 15 domain-containing protein [Chitinimonas taiwanensis]SFZ77021.1 Novel toxin 15 [Chitinimonas taiwanensis DSM 18899]